MRPRLTARRDQVLVLVAQGFGDREIGERLGFSVQAVQMLTVSRERIDAALAERRASRARQGMSPSVAASVAILVADMRLRLRDASEAACRWLGYERAELLRLDASDLVAEHKPAADRYADYLARGEQGGHISLRRQDGSLVSVGYHAHVLHREDKQLYAFVFVPDR
jgi:PAS domain S-box-containing protein